MTEYTFSILEDTKNGKLNGSALMSEIQASTITVAVDSVSSSGDVLTISFRASLSSEEEVILGSVVSAHEGTPLDNPILTKIDTPFDDLERPFFRSESRDPHDNTYFTSNGDLWTIVPGEAVGTGDGSKTEFYLKNKEARSASVYVDGIKLTEGEDYSVDYSTYDSNINEITHFCSGKITFMSAPADGASIMAGYAYATIGAGNQLVFDLAGYGSSSVSSDDGVWTTEISFCDPVHIKDGLVAYQGGEIDSTGNMYIICPQGYPYLENDGTVKVADEDKIIEHYVINQRLLGSAEMGMYFDVECRSKPMPPGYRLRVEVDKGSSTSLKGYVRLEINRQRTIIL